MYGIEYISVNTDYYIDLSDHASVQLTIQINISPGNTLWKSSLEKYSRGEFKHPYHYTI